MDGMIQIACGTTVLADGTASGGIVEELEINGTRLIEKGQPFRAGWISVFDRGNRENQVTFKISTKMASRTAALQSVLTLNDTLPVVATLTITFPENGSTLVAVMAGAGWSSVKPKFTGLSTMVQFSAVGGQFSITVSLNSQLDNAGNVILDNAGNMAPA